MMKVGHSLGERRKRRLFAPFFFFVGEVTLGFEIASAVSQSFDPYRWHIFFLLLFCSWALYTFYKMVRIYKRQKELPPPLHKTSRQRTTSPESLKGSTKEEQRLIIS